MIKDFCGGTVAAFWLVSCCACDLQAPPPCTTTRACWDRHVTWTLRSAAPTVARSSWVVPRRENTLLATCTPSTWVNHVFCSECSIKKVETYYRATYHMASQSVTCHSTQVNARRLNPSQAGRYLIYLPRRDGRLSWAWCYDLGYMSKWFIYLSGDR